jgi:hypothetical protein
VRTHERRAGQYLLIYLRRLDEKADRLLDETRDVKVRLTSVEENLAGVHRRLDRTDVRIDRIERRLDLVDAPT